MLRCVRQSLRENIGVFDTLGGGGVGELVAALNKVECILKHSKMRINNLT